MIGSITSGGALDDDNVNDWAPSRLGAALDDDDVNDWPVTTSFGGYA